MLCTMNQDVQLVLSTLKSFIRNKSFIYFFWSCDFAELTDIFNQRIERLSGSRSGFTVTVRGDRTRLLRIRFTTDSSVTRQGFKAQYSITFGERYLKVDINCTVYYISMRALGFPFYLDNYLRLVSKILWTGSLELMCYKTILYNQLQFRLCKVFNIEY